MDILTIILLALCAVSIITLADMRVEIKRKDRLYHDRLTEAEMIIDSFDCVLNMAHMSENNSLTATFARSEIRNYNKTWRPQNDPL